MTSILELLLLPPLGLLLLAGVGLLVARRRRRLGWTVFGAALLSFVALCVPIVSAALLMTLQPYPSLPPRGPLPGADAVVILGADVHDWAPEHSGPTVGPLTLERLRYGAQVARRSGLPVLVTGGVLEPPSSLAELMRDVLEDELGVPVEWTEARARNTRENARLAAEMLGSRRVFLVTHAWHMPRAKAAFEAAGLAVLPAPMGFRTWPRARLGSFVPSARSLQESRWAIHEWLGRVWYAVTSRG